MRRQFHPECSEIFVEIVTILYRKGQLFKLMKNIEICKLKLGGVIVMNNHNKSDVMFKHHLRHKFKLLICYLTVLIINSNC